MAESTCVCVWCKREFLATRAKYCSRMCHWHDQRGPIPERKCLWCDGSMEGRRRGSLYCSVQHKKNAASTRHRGRNPGYYKPYGQSERMRQWVEENKESRRAYAREYHRRNPVETAAKSKAWREANRVYFQVRERNRKAAKLNNPGSVGVSERDWVRLCRRYDHSCAYCGQKPEHTLQMDHVIPLSKGGRHAIGNVLPACGPCNLTKNAALLILWRYRKICGAYDDASGGISA
jgi:5-methylcytosine-specific restriction endonuclease McrA